MSASIHTPWSVRILLLLALGLLASTVLSAQGPPVISPNGVVNGASFRPPDFPGGQVVPGSLVSIFGQGLGPQGGVQAGGFPLPDELGPLQTRVRINDQDFCRLLYVGEQQINCQLPDGLTGDRIRVRIVTTLGQSDEIEIPLGLSAFGFFTMAGNGRGQAIAQNFVDSPEPANRFRLNAGDNPARPNQVMVYWGTGLGPTDPPTPAGEPAMGQRPATVPPEVFVGGVRAVVQYAGRAPGFAGLDQVQIVIPPEAPEGCAVPVRLQQQDRTSNIGTAAIVRDRDRDRCRDAFEPILSGLSHGSIVLGGGLGRLGPGQLGPQAGYGGPYPGNHGPANPPGPNAGPGGGVLGGRGGVGQTGIGPFGIYPGMHPFAGGDGVMMQGGMGPGNGPGGAFGNPGPDVVTARFVRLDEGATFDIGVPPVAPDACITYSLGPGGLADLFSGPVELLDAGNLLISGPGVTLTLEPQTTARGPVLIAQLPSPLRQGAYMATGMGGAEVGAFGPVTLNVPELISLITSLPSGGEATSRRRSTHSSRWLTPPSRIRRGRFAFTIVAGLPNINGMKRRTFLRTAAAFAAATQAHPILGANDRVNLAVVGVGGRGSAHLGFYNEVPNCNLAAACDVNQAARERAEALIQKLQGHKAKTYRDMRELYDDKEVDAVSIATPNHWHALATIWACQAGKDVYVEKPACHNVFEGQQMVAAARKYNRVVQVGSQSRSIGHKRMAIQMLRDGVIGDVYMARGLCYRRRKSIGHTPVEPVPAGVDWDFFLGPAPLHEYTKNRFDYNWHWFWDTGNGDIGNQGVHEMDICRWALDLDPDEKPKTAVSSGGKFLWEDDQETPNMQQASFSYPGKEILFDVRNLHTGTESQIPLDTSVVGNLIYGSKGFMILYPTGVQVFIGDDHEKTVDEKNQEERVWTPVPHMTNFLDAVRKRDPKLLHADVAVGAQAASLCHYANASYRVGRVVTVDQSSGMAAGDAEAAAILTRKYREPYVVPEQV